MNRPLAGASVLRAIVERAVGLDIRAAEDARVVHSCGGERVEVLAVIEVEVHHRAVMFARSDEHRRFAAPLEVMRILRVQRDRVRGMKTAAENGREQECESSGHGMWN